MQESSQCDMSELFHIACEAAHHAGTILKNQYGKQKEILYKSRIDLVTDVDIKSEKAILTLIKSRYPGHDIITEESNPELQDSDFRWIIDPLDGTVNYAHNYPFIAVSIALEINGVTEIGIVYNPIMDEFFTAQKGNGAFLNNRPLSVSETDELGKSFLATGFPYDIRENPYNNLAHFNHLIKRAQALRRDGSAALNLCHTAMGRFDGYWELTIAPWDIAAGALITQEAGGTVTNLRGEPLSIYDRQIVATNGKIHTQLVKEIQQVNREQYDIT